MAQNSEHILSALILFARIGDMGSTRLATPHLALEANPLVRKLGWRFAVLTLLACVTPYFSMSLGIVVLVPSLLVAAANTGRIWFVRAYGEREYAELLVTVARKSRLRNAVACVLCSACFIAIAGVVLLMLAPNPTSGWVAAFAFGILSYALAVAVHGSASVVRVFRKARARDGENDKLGTVAG